MSKIIVLVDIKKGLTEIHPKNIIFVIKLRTILRNLSLRVVVLVISPYLFSTLCSYNEVLLFFIYVFSCGLFVWSPKLHAND